MTDLLSSSQFWLLVSIGFYALGVEIQKKTGSAVCNPLLIASILVGALLIATGTPYQTYEESGKLISFFLTPATVALAIPIYRKLDVLLHNLLPILLGAFVGSLVSISSVILFSHLFGLSDATTRSLIPKSVTTPIGVALARSSIGRVVRPSDGLFVHRTGWGVHGACWASIGRVGRQYVIVTFLCIAHWKEQFFRSFRTPAVFTACSTLASPTGFRSL